MDELEISGKRYISAKLAAKEHKYHSDYIGQLVRGKKVAGQKVGRAWYVDAESLAEYLGKEVPKKASVNTDPSLDRVVSEIPVEVEIEAEAEVVEDPAEETPPAEPAELEVEPEEAVEEVEVKKVEPEFAPFRKSGRHHVIAALDKDEEPKEEKIVIRSYQPIEPEVSFAEQEKDFAKTFDAIEVQAEEKTDDTFTDEEETFIPVKITQPTKQKEPEDSFYKVSRKSLQYVSGNTPVQTSVKKTPSVAATEIKDVPFTNNRTQSANKGLNILTLAGVVVMVAVVSLGAGVFASYYLQSETTIGAQGQTSSIVLSK